MAIQQRNLNENEREHMIEWLTLWSGYARSYWEKEPDEKIELNYKGYCGDFAQ